MPFVEQTIDRTTDSLEKSVKDFLTRESSNSFLIDKSSRKFKPGATCNSKPRIRSNNTHRTLVTSPSSSQRKIINNNNNNNNNIPSTTIAIASTIEQKAIKSLTIRCEFCEKTFDHAGDKRKHRRCHTGERPYVCHVCRRAFSQHCNLTRHKRVHTGEKPFRCVVCERSFARSDKLAEHVARCKSDKRK